MRSTIRKLLVVSLSAGALFVGVPSQAATTEDTPQADQNFCEFVPRICQALCIRQPNRCGPQP